MGKRYADSPNGPVQRAFRLRMQGKPYDRIVAILKLEYPDECALLNWETVRGWGASGRLHWDEIRDAVTEIRLDDVPENALPGDAQVVKSTEKLIIALSDLFDVQKEPNDELLRRIALWKVRPDTMLDKQQKRYLELTRSSLIGIPKKAIQRVTLLVFGELVRELLDRKLVSADRMKKDAASIQAALIRRMPDVLGRAAAEETIPDGDHA